MSRLEHLTRFYALLDDLEQRLGGARKLGDCTGELDWPTRGVYFFREAGELRSDTNPASTNSAGNPLRVVHVGTHAVSKHARATLWGRLRAHQGTANAAAKDATDAAATQAGPAGDHRKSELRRHIGWALMARDHHSCPTWGDGKSAPKAIRRAEQLMERSVSATLGEMELLWLEVADPPSRKSLRARVAHNAIALLSYCNQPALDPPSPEWLGRFSPRPEIVAAGLWNQSHITEPYDPGFLDAFAKLINKVG